MSGPSVEISPGFFSNLLGLWAGFSWFSSWKHPERPWSTNIFIGAISGFGMVLADVGHAFAHSISARLAGAPMDRIKLSSGMPRTLYDDNDVPPRAHRMRAMGGPIFSTLGLLISWLMRAVAPKNSLTREVANWSCIGHGLILTGSLAPLPIVDGGSLLKWTLVDRGSTPEEADRAVQQAGIATGIAATGIGAIFAARRNWLPALGLIAAGLVAIISATGKLR